MYNSGDGRRYLLHSRAPPEEFLPDSDVDVEWVPEYADFAKDASDGMATCP